MKNKKTQKNKKTKRSKDQKINTPNNQFNLKIIQPYYRHFQCHI